MKVIIYKLIIGYDHHCPWTSKCIGEGNLKGFYVFVISTMLFFGYLIFAMSTVDLHDHQGSAGNTGNNGNKFY